MESVWGLGCRIPLEALDRVICWKQGFSTETIHGLNLANYNSAGSLGGARCHPSTPNPKP